MAMAWDPERRAKGVTPLAVAVGAFATWTIGSTLFSAAYTPAGIFQPLFLLTGFVFARGASERGRESLFALLVGGAVALALWALWQSASGGGRAHAHFETPNTLATLLNLVLATLAFRVAHREATRPMLMGMVLIAAGLAATLSRGGIIALGAGLALTLVLCPVRPTRSGLLRALVALLIGAVIGCGALLLPRWQSAEPVAEQAQVESVATTLASSVGSRVELYRLALTAAQEHPWRGAGYLGFQAQLEAHRAEVPSYATENITYFVHNDYLQTLVELGVPGLIALLAVVLVPFHRRGGATPAYPALRYAPLAGIATMAIHALGDFPFYVPVCLLVFGMLVGQVDATTDAPTARFAWAKSVRRLGAVLGAAAMAIVLLPPPLAEAAAAYGDRSWRANHAQAAAYGFELARRLQPRDWRYHWYAGQFWYVQAQAGNAAAAPLADRAFAAASAANPFEPRVLLSRIATQMRFARWLDHPESAATLREWAERALALAPLNPGVRRDHAAALAQLSHKP